MQEETRCLYCSGLLRLDRTGPRMALYVCDADDCQARLTAARAVQTAEIRGLIGDPEADAMMGGSGRNAQ